MYRVISSFEQHDDDERFLQINIDDLLVSCTPVNSDWMSGKIMNTERSGLVPLNCLEEVKQCPSKDEFRPQDSNEYRELDASVADLTVNPLHETVSNNSISANRNSCNYVDMSSGEKLNSSPDLFARQRAKKLEFEEAMKNSKPKQQDEGYSSHSSGEGAPLIDKPLTVSKQDEAGYEVPQVPEEAEDEQGGNNKKKRCLRSFWKRKSGSDIDIDNTLKNDDQSNYYDPPSDFRDSYFLRHTNCFRMRFLICFIIALTIAIALLLALYLVAEFHILLSFLLALVVFIISLVLPVTLINRGVICTVVLVFPSVFSCRAKWCLTAFLLFMILLGPGLGIVDKFNIAKTCPVDVESAATAKPLKQNYALNPTYGRLYNECIASFQRVNRYCLIMLKGYHRSCQAVWSLSKFEKQLCSKTSDYFCRSNKTIDNLCSITTNLKRTAKPKTVFLSEYNSVVDHPRRIIFYLMVLLALILLSEAYGYNKIYLTKKDTDNIYITQKLKDLDRERKNRGLSDFVVPLTRIEFQIYLIRKSLSLSRKELYEIKKWLVVWLISGLAVLSSVLLEDSLDVVFSEVLQGPCRARYLHLTVIHYRTLMYVLVGAFLFLIVLQTYALRLRSVICEYFYKDIVDTRTKHLYYKILHDRHTFARHIRRKIQLMSEEKRLRERISFRSKLYELLNPQLQWLCKKLCVRKCMVCDSITYTKTVECEQLSCKAHYCFECFVDAGQYCLTCHTTTSQPQVNNTDSIVV